jgi:hypothetical protein
VVEAVRAGSNVSPRFASCCWNSITLTTTSYAILGMLAIKSWTT